jgi:hypothetical protein
MRNHLSRVQWFGLEKNEEIKKVCGKFSLNFGQNNGGDLPFTTLQFSPSIISINHNHHRHYHLMSRIR